MPVAKALKVLPKQDAALDNVKKLVSNLNHSLIKLEVDRNRFKTEVEACEGLCSEIKELIHATTKRVIPSS